MGSQRSLDLTDLFAEWTEVDVTFPSSANTDVAIRHDLTPPDPNNVYYFPVRKSAAAHVYHDTTGTRRAWQSGTIYLRSDVANVKMKLILYVPRKAGTATF